MRRVMIFQGQTGSQASRPTHIIAETLDEFRYGRGRDHATDVSGASRLVIIDTTIKVTNANGIVTMPG